jgi:acetate kinase
MDSHGSRLEVGSSQTGFEQAGRSFILTVNGGSSSLKFALFAPGHQPERLVSGKVERIGMQESSFIVTCADGGREMSKVTAPDQATAVAHLIGRLEQFVSLEAIAIIGHRVVHGGSRFYRPEIITPEVLDELRRIVPYDPDHPPG